MLFKFKHADKIVGFFVLVAIVSFCMVLIVIGINKQWFTANHPFQSRFASASGISKGMPIYLSGFEIGKVTALSLNDNNQVDIRFVVYDRFIDKIKTDSVIELVNSPIGLGSKMVLYPGKNDRERLPDHSFIDASESSEGKKLIKAGLVDKPMTSDSISEMLSNLNTTIVSINTLLEELNGAATGTTDTPLAGILTNVDTITGNLGRLSAGMQSPEGLVPTLLASPGSSIDTFFNDDNRLYNRVYSIVGGLDESAGNIAGMTGSLSGITPELALTLEQLNATMTDAQKVMEGLQNNPLLKQGISPEKEAVRSKTDIRDEQF